MLLIRKGQKDFPKGNELDELSVFLRQPPQELNKSGVLRRIKKTYPYGRQNPLYDADQVEMLEANLASRDGLVAFKVLQLDAPLT